MPVQLRHILSRVDAFLFAPVNKEFKASVFINYAQKASFCVCFVFGLIVFCVMGKSSITWDILGAYWAVAFFASLCVFFLRLSPFERKDIFSELRSDMTVFSAVFIIFAYGLAAVSLFLISGYFFIGIVPDAYWYRAMSITLMAYLAGSLPAFLITYLELAICRLFLK